MDDFLGRQIRRDIVTENYEEVCEWEDDYASNEELIEMTKIQATNNLKEAILSFKKGNPLDQVRNLRHLRWDTNKINYDFSLSKVATVIYVFLFSCVYAYTCVYYFLKLSFIISDYMNPSLQLYKLYIIAVRKLAVCYAMDLTHSQAIVPAIRMRVCAEVYN